MQIRYGYELIFSCPQSTPMIFMLHTHPSRVPDLIRPDTLVTEPQSYLSIYSDVYGNTCTRLIATPGHFRVNGTVQNMPEFQKAFSCKAGQPMVSQNACHVW